jgi:hypothetical protein
MAHQATIRSMYGWGYTKNAILDILSVRHGFRPSFEQLRHKMRQWDLTMGSSTSLQTPETPAELPELEPDNSSRSLTEATRSMASVSGSLATTTEEPRCIKTSPTVLAPHPMPERHNKPPLPTTHSIPMPDTLGPSSSVHRTYPTNTAYLPSEPIGAQTASTSFLDEGCPQADSVQHGWNDMDDEEIMSNFSRDTFATHSSDTSSLREFRGLAGELYANPPTLKHTLSRTSKHIRMRVSYTCHVCNRPFGQNRTCGNCAHKICNKCQRYPPRKPAQAAGMASSLIALESTAGAESLLANHELELDLIINDIQSYTKLAGPESFPKDMLNLGNEYMTHG